MTTSTMVRLPGEELNRRLEELSLRIERVSLLIEDAMVDPSAMVNLDLSKYNDLILCLSKYGELLNSFQESTGDVTEEIRGILGLEEECFYGETDCDEDIEVPGEDEDNLE
jgi:hypothetical protein